MPEEPIENVMDTSTLASLQTTSTSIPSLKREPHKNDGTHFLDKKGISTIPNLITSDNMIEDEDDIDVIIYKVQAQQSRFQDLLNKLQDHSKKLLTLK